MWDVALGRAVRWAGITPLAANRVTSVKEASPKGLPWGHQSQRQAPDKKLPSAKRRYHPIKVARAFYFCVSEEEAN